MFLQIEELRQELWKRYQVAREEAWEKYEVDREEHYIKINTENLEFSKWKRKCDVASEEAERKYNAEMKELKRSLVTSLEFVHI